MRKQFTTLKVFTYLRTSTTEALKMHLEKYQIPAFIQGFFPFGFVSLTLANYGWPTHFPAGPVGQLFLMKLYYVSSEWNVNNYM